MRDAFALSCLYHFVTEDGHTSGTSECLRLLSVLCQQVFALLPPSPENLATFAAWASSVRWQPVFLAQHADGAEKVEVPAGATLFIPGAPLPQTGALRTMRNFSNLLIGTLMWYCADVHSLLRTVASQVCLPCMLHQCTTKLL